MDKAQLLTEFQGHVEEFDRFQSFILKARSQSGKFAPAVVEKVIKDNTEKSMAVVEQIIPLIADMEDVIAKFGTERSKILDGRQTSQFALEELELRLAIGEMTEAEFELEGQNLRDQLSSIDGRVGSIDKELNQFKGLMQLWNELGEKAGVFTKQPEKEEKKPKESAKEEKKGKGKGNNKEEEKAPEPARETKTLPFDEGDDDAIVASIDEEELEGASDEDEEDLEIEEGGGSHVEKVRIEEDLSAVLGGGETEIIGSDRSKLDEIDILGDDNELEVEAGAADDGGSSSEEARRAVLLYQEGTAEEQIYPFNGEEMTLGRGRDNDIQVKNDSKVSRYHCKLYRRGPNFYIEDNKSANGTLVNGELITERRLFGGEEIIIGETFFRFRIMD
jgi:hypothetical protein